MSDLAGAAIPTGQVRDACIGGILFADVVGFSRLAGDDEVLRFIQEFLGRVGVLTDTSPYAPLVRNTWGDGLYFIFASVRDAGLYALSLCDMVSGTSWAERQLPADLNIRVALHAGPVFAFTDPVTGQPTWSGKHVARAARMEPITPPGTVYASREFAAIAAAQRVEEFRCEPVGRVRLDKRDGFARLFVVQPCDNGQVPRMTGW